MQVGIIGMGVVGQALHGTFKKKHITRTYDINGKWETFEDVLKTEIIFLCLPTPTKFISGRFQQSNIALSEVLSSLNEANYKGIIVIKSTVLPGTTEEFGIIYPDLKLVHNPEFLSEKTAKEDFKNSKSVLISSKDFKNSGVLVEFYKKTFPDLELKFISFNPKITEMAKYMCNVFYATKISIFNEFYDICQKLNIDFREVKTAAMCSNDWIGMKHTEVPGPDGKRGWGGMCFPKDVEALLGFAEKQRIDIPTIKASYDYNKKVRDDLE